MTSLWRTLADTPHEIRYVDAAGRRTRVLRSGSGEPVLLLHGTGGHLEAYLRNIAELAGEFDVVAIDLLGHGCTQLPAAGEFDWRSVAEHVAATMDALGIGSATWVGEALGAQAAQWAAAKLPDRVSRVVICCAGILPTEDPNEAATSDAQKAFQELTASALADPSAVDVMRERMRWLHLGDEHVDEELLELRMAFWCQTGFVEAQRRLLLSLRTARHDTRTRLTIADIKAVAVPALVLWSERNPLMPVDAAYRLAALLPDSRVELFAESAMWPQFDEAARFNGVLLDWLRATKC